MAKKKKGLFGKILKGLVTLVLAAVSGAIVLQMLQGLVLYGGKPAEGVQASGSDEAIMDKYDMFMTNEVADALDGVLAVEKVYWLSDEDIVAPEPNQDCFGTSSDPAQLQWLLNEAKDTLGMENTLFSTATPIWEGSEVNYYLDETICSITWKQVIDGCVYVISEVKIAHPSQFRRFLADGTFGSDKQYLTTQMAESVNAVTASNADFYKHRSYGIVVYNGDVYRANGQVDTCYIDNNGDMLFTREGEINDKTAAEAFVEENNIRFSLAFGPILVDNYENVAPDSYRLGEIDKGYARAALAQMDELHYLLIVASSELAYQRVPTIAAFARQVQSFGCEKAYSLDGGQTAVIVTNNTLINRPVYGYQRTVSDMIYFATAVPDGG